MLQFFIIIRLGIWDFSRLIALYELILLIIRFIKGDNIYLCLQFLLYVHWDDL